MRLILSRKGFDSSSGGMPSPVLEGRPQSLPIPQPGPRSMTLDRLPLHEGGSLGDLVAALSRGKIAANLGVHLDPDLEIHDRTDWLPAFGQQGAALKHLDNRGVREGDLFLFFGWFRDAERLGGHWRFVPNSDRMEIFGWLQIGQRLDPGHDVLPVALESHPHAVYRAAYRSGNALFLPSRQLVLPNGRPSGLPGHGVLRRSRAQARLTQEGATRSRWRLPGWFLPEDGRPRLSYHEDASRWQRDGDDALLVAVNRGQEFVLPVQAQRVAASRWIREVLGGVAAG